MPIPNDTELLPEPRVMLSAPDPVFMVKLLVIAEVFKVKLVVSALASMVFSVAKLL